MFEKIEKNYSNNNDFVELFEQKLCEYTGAPFAVAVDKCTNAILLSLEYFNDKSVVLSIPSQTYISVPMTLLNLGYKIIFEDKKWKGSYRIGKTCVYDYAVGFEKDMYVSGQIQCLSFQQKKRLPIGKGGAILLDDENMYKKLKRMRHDGRDSSIPVSKENPNDIIMGYHMYMSPDEAVKGILLMNQLTNTYNLGSYKDYPNLKSFPIFKDFM
jgi:dTDP-4-amino-4,6-dideoxygalactose transaminase